MRVKRPSARRSEPAFSEIFFKYFQVVITLLGIWSWRFKGFILLGFALYIGGSWAFSPQQWAISKVKIDAPARQASPIKSVLTPFLENGWLFLDQQSIETVLRNLPYVETAQVEKIFPDELRLQITEFNPVARWQKTPTHQMWLVSSTGQLFKGETSNPLPIWRGDISQLSQLKEQFEFAQAILEQRALKISELQINSWGSWRLVLQNGQFLKIGKDFSRLQHFIKWYAKLPANAVGFDLRYPHGVAVSF
ncbi:MAG: hypothetical protein RIT27_928 [Pseudomonadota bacterium]|jgi:cell division protein FtsQ